MADHPITKKKPSKVVISAFKKRICTNNTGVNRSDIIVEPRNNQVNPIFKIISAFKKRNCTNHTGVNIRDVIVEPSNTPANPSLGVISAFKKRNFTHNTGVNRRAILVEPSNTQLNPSVEVISAFKKSNCTNNKVDNLNSTAQEYSVQKKEQSLESAHQDTCRVWSGATKDINNVSDSNCSKDSNVINFTKEQCRVCLKKGSIPIYGHKSNEYLADTIMTVGGVEISTFDNYPKYLCRHCLKLLLNAVIFRNTAQISDQQFRKLTEKEEPEKFNNKAMSEDDTFSDDDISSDNEEPDVLENHIISHTGLIDQLTKLLENPTETRSEPKHLNTNKHRDDFSNINKGNPLQKHQYHNTTKILQNPSATNTKPSKLINIVIPKHSRCNLNDNTLNKHLDQHITEYLPKSSNNEHEKINDDRSRGTDNTSRESLNQIITKILQKLPQTKLEQAKIINIIMPREDHSSCYDNGNTLQENNKENVTEILQKKPEIKSERSKIINIIMPKDYHYVQRINEILKKSSVTSDHTNDDSNSNNMTNTLQENIHNNTNEIIDKTVETEPETANLKHNKMPPDDYFGDIAKRISDRERNYRKLEPISVICDECGSLCGSYREYANHYIDKHPERKKLQCTICQKDYIASYFARHMTYHSQGAYVCDICGVHFLDLANFKGHCRTHTTELPFKCSLCAYRGRLATSVKLHMMSHTGERPHKCPQCPKRFINTGNLKRHILKHRGERPFKCETCKRGYFTKGDVIKHKLNVHHGKDKHNVCRFCGMYFNTKNNWSRHEREVHKRPTFHHRLPLYVKYDMILKHNENISSMRNSI